MTGSSSARGWIKFVRLHSRQEFRDLLLRVRVGLWLGRHDFPIREMVEMMVPKLPDLQ